jgi:hypothetical protein
MDALSGIATTIAVLTPLIVVALVTGCVVGLLVWWLKK